MKRLVGVLVVLAVMAGCSDDPQQPVATGTVAPPSTPVPTSAPVSTSAVTTSTAPAQSLQFTGVHDRAGSLWDIELLGVVTGLVSPGVNPRSRTQPPCLALVVHATYIGTAPLGSADNLSLGSTDGGGRGIPGACIPDDIELQHDYALITPGTSVIATFGMVEFEQPLPDVEEIYVRDPTADTTDSRTIAVAPSVNLPATTIGPDPSPLADPTTPILHEAADGTVTITIVGMWPEPVSGGTCWHLAATFTVSEEVHAITVEAVDPPYIVAAGRVRWWDYCGSGGAPGDPVDPDLIWYQPGTTYGMGWSYFLPDGVAPQAILPSLAEPAPEFVAINFLDGPPPPP